MSVLKDIDVDLHALATWWDVLRVAKASGYFETTLDEVEIPARTGRVVGGARRRNVPEGLTPRRPAGRRPG